MSAEIARESGRDGALERCGARELSLDALAGRRLAKRIVDLIFIAIFLAPILAVCAVVGAVILVTMGRPVLFRQERVGLAGRPFEMRKFRTMAVKAAGDATTGVEDARVTRLGGWLRRHRIDECPQVLNVILGHMSLVGPRPEQPHLAADYGAHLPEFSLRHRLRPGVTGLAQVSAPYAADLDGTRVKLAHDLDYVRNATLALDLVILMRTIGVVLTGRGAR